MRKATVTILLIVPALLLLAAAASASPDNAAVEKAITAALVDKLGADAQTIRVAFFDGKATLSGQVQKDATQELSKEVALYVPGVTKVENQVEAKEERHVGTGKMLAESDDAGMESDVKAKLRSELGSYAGQLEVEACNGVVSVRGSVPDKPRHDYAIAAAQKVKGVTQVIDLIRFAAH
jgi:osmotically-inducible protein OsmY